MHSDNIEDVLGRRRYQFRRDDDVLVHPRLQARNQLLDQEVSS
jgi:hypothetical protein